MDVADVGFDSAASAYFEKLKSSSKYEVSRDRDEVLSTVEDRSSVEDRLSRLEAFQEKTWRIVEHLCRDASKPAARAALCLERGDDLISTIGMQARLQEDHAKLQVILKELERETERPQKVISSSPSLSNEVRALLKAELLQELRVEISRDAAALVPPDKNAIDDVATITDSSSKSQTYSFTESIWELGVFVCHPSIGLGGSLVVTLLLVLNIVMQTAFCIICQLNFTDNAFDEASREGLQAFRLTYAHDVRFVNGDAETLAQQICDEDVDSAFKMNKLFYGTSQVANVGAVRSYLNTDGNFVEVVFGGQLLCILALMCWILTVFKHFKRSYYLAAAVFDVPIGSSTRIEASPEDDDFVLESISLVRKIFVMFTVVLRGACYGLLLYSGGAWLSYTTDATDLVLNAAALEFVLDIDELLFLAMAPEVSKVFLSRVRPIPCRHQMLPGGLDLHSLGLLITLPVTTAMFYAFLVRPLVNDMREAERIVCGGRTDIAFSRDQAMGMLWFLHVSKEDSLIIPAGISEDEKARLMDATSRIYDASPVAVNDMIQGETPSFGNEASKHPYVDITITNVFSLEIKDFADLLNVGCSDTALTSGSYLSLVQLYLMNNSLRSCADVASFCMLPSLSNIEAVKFMRVLCPESCGCISPLSIIPDHRASFGCPSGCSTHVNFNAQIESLSCNDISPTVLRSSLYFPMWIKYAEEKFRALLGAPAAALDVYGAFMNYGCKFFAVLPKSELARICEGNSDLLFMRPVSPICPETCDCASGIMGGCAPQCTPILASNLSADLVAVRDLLAKR